MPPKASDAQSTSAPTIRKANVRLFNFMLSFLSDAHSLPYYGVLCYTSRMGSPDTAVIFEVREFCLHDGPGVRTTVFFKGCPLRCAWCHNPEGLSPLPEIIFKERQCVRCGNCRNLPDDISAIARACPQGMERAFERVCPQRAKVVCGRRWTVPELARELLSNADVFASSGGGITFSGGEPLIHADFIVKFINYMNGHMNGDRPLAHGDRPLHMAIETSGYASATDYQAVISRMDLVFQDLKHPDPVAHKRWTGTDPAPIHANLRWLKASGKPFIARIPLIPGVNDSLEAKEGFARLLEGKSGLQRVELLPYHITAGAKYPCVGRKYAPGFDESRSPNTDLSPFVACGLDAVVM